MTSMDLAEFQDKKIHILGPAGIEGYSLTRFFVERGVGQVTVHDLADELALRRRFMSLHLYYPRPERAKAFGWLRQAPVEWCLGDDYLRDLEQADWLFVSQNWFAYGENKPVAKWIAAHPERVMTLVDLYLRLFPGRVMGVTGTNGKSTTVELLSQMVAADRGRVFYGGNERTKQQALLNLEQAGEDDLLVLEISNRHLRGGLKRGPEIAVITNVTPNHVEDHGSLEAYYLAKRGILENQPPGSAQVINADDPVSGAWASQADNHWQFSARQTVKRGLITQEGIVRLMPGDRELVDWRETRLGTPHEQANALAAGTAALAAGLGVDAVVAAWKSYQPLPGRLELVEERGGVEFYYDIKSTVPQATAAAVESLAPEVQGKLWLIVGGEEKGSPLDPLVQVMQKHPVQLMALSGSLQAGLFDALEDAKWDGERALYEQFDQAWQSLRSRLQPGDVVLLSPGGAGFYSRHFEGQLGFRQRVREM